MPNPFDTGDPAGTLVVKHRYAAPANGAPFTVAITGGTGRYRGASGEAVARQPNPPTNVYVYKLRLQTGAKQRS